MIRCLILDDEKSAIEILSHYIKDTPYLSIVGATVDSSEATEIIREGNVDLIFLDIEMPKLSGLQFIDLYCKDIDVILTTAYTNYALEGYEKNVIDYLLKPIMFDRFLKATEKALHLSNKKNVGIFNSKEVEEDFILVKTEHKGKYRKVNFSEIIFVEGMKNYISIFTNKQEQIVTYIGIGDIEDKLPKNKFIRVHRSYIVAIDYIIAIDGNEIYMKDAPRIPMAGNFKDDLFQQMELKFLQNRK
jgi:two-component system, LytTR family, response regulator